MRNCGFNLKQCFKYLNPNKNENQIDFCLVTSFDRLGGDDRVVGDKLVMTLLPTDGSKFISTDGSCGGKINPCDALAVRWQDYLNINQKIIIT